MSLTIDELSPKFILAKETRRATPARRHHTGRSAVRTTLFRPCLALHRGVAKAPLCNRLHELPALFSRTFLVSHITVGYSAENNECSPVLCHARLQ
jgi:hypothetical protein